MIRSITFQKQFIPLIESGQKTVTRRAKTKLSPGEICYFKIGRFGKKQGYLKIHNIIKVRLKDIRGDIRELENEGFIVIGLEYSFIMLDFIDLWNKLNKKGYKWEENPYVYRIKFEYIGKEIK